MKDRATHASKKPPWRSSKSEPQSLGIEFSTFAQNSNRGIAFGIGFANGARRVPKKRGRQRTHQQPGQPKSAQAAQN
jgi:hypothetical protein